MYAQKRSIENSHIVRERDRRRFRELLALVLLGLPLGVFLLIFTWQNLEVIRLGRELTRLQATRDKLANANKNLRLDIERLTSLAAVEEKAITLGFTPTEASRIVLISAQGEGGG
jgi:cell division protein FtsB